ncbi:MAG: hypothetical protein FJY85_14170, partial [Deltaproteobacteria bacterium]|nr:hypothetical protein [Deltaproteobacteria bacterium]
MQDDRKHAIDATIRDGLTASAASWTRFTGRTGPQHAGVPVDEGNVPGNHRARTILVSGTPLTDESYCAGTPMVQLPTDEEQTWLLRSLAQLIRLRDQGPGISMAQRIAREIAEDRLLDSLPRAGVLSFAEAAARICEMPEYVVEYEAEKSLVE